MIEINKSIAATLRMKASEVAYCAIRLKVALVEHVLTMYTFKVG